MSQFLNVGVGVDGEGIYPISNPGVAYVSEGLGVAQWDNGVNPPFFVPQFVCDPSATILISPAPPCGYTFFLAPQDSSAPVGDGKTYWFSDGYVQGSPIGAHQSYAPFLTAISITDLTLINFGTAHLAAIAIGRHLDGGGSMDQSTPGGTNATSLLVTFPKNVTLLPPAGGLDVNNPPTITVDDGGGGCGTSGYTFAITAGALPAGMTLNTSTGVISGTPTASGPYSVTIGAQRITGSTYCWGDVTYTGFILIGSSGLAIGGSATGPLFINALPQWQIHQLALKSRSEESA